MQITSRILMIFIMISLITFSIALLQNLVYVSNSMGNTFQSIGFTQTCNLMDTKPEKEKENRVWVGEKQIVDKRYINK